MASCKKPASGEAVCDLLTNIPCYNQELVNVKMKDSYPSGAAFSSLSVLDGSSDLQYFEDGSMLEDLSVEFASLLQVQISNESISTDPCQVNSSSAETVQEGFNELNELATSDQIKKRKLGKSATFSSSENRNLCEPTVSLIMSSENHICQDSGDYVSIKAEKASCSRSISFPSSLKLVSALKGGRQQLGLSPKAKLSVKWAADVYDPPTTSMSHTVKNHQQRPKAKKKDKQKHKHKGSRSTRGKSSDKQRSGWNLSKPAEPLNHIRLQPSADRMLLDGLPYTDMAIAEFATGTNDSTKCRSSILVGVLDKPRLPMAEAS